MCNYMMKQKTEIGQAQVAEALARMKKLNIHRNAIKEFNDEGKLNKSVKGGLFWLNEVEEQMVREWEEKTGCIVYHIIEDKLEFGLCYSFLYVSQETEEWQLDAGDIENGICIAYVKNMDAEFCSEYGSIGIAPFFGGVIRTA